MVSLDSLREPRVDLDVTVLPWRVLCVWSRKEHEVTEHLRNRGFEPFLPVSHRLDLIASRYKPSQQPAKRRRIFGNKWVMCAAPPVRIEPLFTGYVFAQFPDTSRNDVLRTPFVREVLSFGGELAIVSPDEIDLLRRLEESGVPVTPANDMAVGKLVRVTSGAFKGKEGVITRAGNRSLITVKIEGIDRYIVAEFDRRLVERVA